MEKTYKIHRNAKINHWLLKIGIAKKVSKYFKNKKYIKTCNLMKFNIKFKVNKQSKCRPIIPILHKTRNHHSIIPTQKLKKNKTLSPTAFYASPQRTASLISTNHPAAHFLQQPQSFSNSNSLVISNNSVYDSPNLTNAEILVSDTSKHTENFLNKKNKPIQPHQPDFLNAENRFLAPKNTDKTAVFQSPYETFFSPKKETTISKHSPNTHKANSSTRYSKHTAKDSPSKEKPILRESINSPMATADSSQKWYHFVGIGGISMSALANLLSYEKNKITGSDLNPTLNPDLNLDKFPTYTGHKSENIGNCDVVVYNSAIKETNPEIMRAKEKNITLKGRAELLSEIADTYENVISISGTHGKTTTTEMIAEVFIHAGKNPTVHLGGISNYFNSNLHIGDKEFFITEACEYKNSFLSLKSTVGVILNIEPEHLDFFKSFSEIKDSFSKFAYTSKMTVAPCNLNPSKTIIFKDNQGFSAKNISTSKDGKISFDCYFKDSYFDTIILNALGLHNVDNALACIATADYFKIKKEYIRKAFLNYKGVKRRMEIIKTNPLIISDYAHHPTEILSSINALKRHLGVPQPTTEKAIILNIDKRENVENDNIKKGGEEKKSKIKKAIHAKEREANSEKNILKSNDKMIDKVKKNANHKNKERKNETNEKKIENHMNINNAIKTANFPIEKQTELNTKISNKAQIKRSDNYRTDDNNKTKAQFLNKKGNLNNFIQEDNPAIKKKMKQFTDNIKRKISESDKKLKTKSQIKSKKKSENSDKTSKNPLLIVFQPHTYSRTQAFMNDFVKVLSVADTTFIYRTYVARERPIKGASAYDLYLKLRKIKKNTKYFKNFIDLAENIKQESENSSMTTLILGAGDIEKLIPLLA